MQLASLGDEIISEDYYAISSYCKIPIISPGLIFVDGLILGGAYFRRGLLLERILHFKIGWT